jgi:DNA polymerase-3 subunit delta
MANKTKASQCVKPVYVICGKDEYLVGNACKELLDRLLPEEHRPMALYQPEANQAEITNVLDELRTLPFLAEKRVVLIKKAGPFVTAYRENLEKYLDDPATKGVLILTVDTWMKTTRLAKKLPKVGELIEVAPPKPWQMPQFIADHIKQKSGKTISRGTAQLLVELAGDDPGRLTSEAEKLCMYVGDKKAITSEDVEALIGHNRMFNAFAVIDAVTANDTTSAIERLRSMFDSDKSTEFTVVGAFAFHFRRMFKAKALIERGVNQTQAAKQAGVWANADAFIQQMSRMSLDRIGSIMSELAKIDYAMKTGGTTARVAIERLVIRLGMK